MGKDRSMFEISRVAAEGLAEMPVGSMNQTEWHDRIYNVVAREWEAIELWLCGGPGCEVVVSLAGDN